MEVSGVSLIENNCLCCYLSNYFSGILPSSGLKLLTGTVRFAHILYPEDIYKFVHISTRKYWKEFLSGTNICIIISIIIFDKFSYPVVSSFLDRDCTFFVTWRCTNLLYTDKDRKNKRVLHWDMHLRRAIFWVISISSQRYHPEWYNYCIISPYYCVKIFGATQQKNNKYTLLLEIPQLREKKEEGDKSRSFFNSHTVEKLLLSLFLSLQIRHPSSAIPLIFEHERLCFQEKCSVRKYTRYGVYFATPKQLTNTLNVAAR